MTLSSPLIACLSLLLLSSCASAPTATPAYLAGPAYTVYAAGDIADCRQRGWQYTGAALTAELIAGELAGQPEAAVLSLGDHTYPAGLAAEFRDCYAPTWGRFKERTYPTPATMNTMVPRRPAATSITSAGPTITALAWAAGM